MTFEYKIFPGITSCQAEQKLNKYALKGWKLDQFVPIPGVGYTIVMIRELKEEN